MKKVLLAGTDLAVSRLAFGTASLHHLVRPRQRADLLRAAADAGITHFDTARIYGEGLAERALGAFLAGRRPEFTLATKIGFDADPLQEALPALIYPARVAGAVARRLGRAARERPRALAPAQVARTLEASLRALRTDWVDILFIHVPRESDVPALARISEWLRALKRDGRARWLGLSGIAGDCVRVEQTLPGLFDILQVEDSLDGCEADALTATGRPLQITFGYLRRAAREGGGDAARVLARALERNRGGSILVSTRQPARIREMARIAEGGT